MSLDSVQVVSCFQCSCPALEAVAAAAAAAAVNGGSNAAAATAAVTGCFQWQSK